MEVALEMIDTAASCVRYKLSGSLRETYRALSHNGCPNDLKAVIVYQHTIEALIKLGKSYPPVLMVRQIR
jgi:hypothetical protein